MGTHISRVKSVDLDAWTDEQVDSMVKWGNEKCNLYWEAKLPQGYVPDSSKIENFIRTKYGMKKWASLPKINNPLTLHTSSSVASSTMNTASDSNGTKSMLSVDSKAANAPHKSSFSGKPKIAELLLDGDFGSFSSAPTANKLVNTDIGASPNTKPAVVSVDTVVSDQRKDLKKSILSLYSTPSSSSSSLSFNNNTQSFPMAAASIGAMRNSPAISQKYSVAQNRPLSASSQASRANNNDSVASISNSSMVLDFGPPAAQTHVTKPISLNPTPTPFLQHGTQKHMGPSLSSVKEHKSSWNNEWSELPASDNPWNSSSSLRTPISTPAAIGRNSASLPIFHSDAKELEDDLFENVWS